MIFWYIIFEQTKNIRNIIKQTLDEKTEKILR